MKNIIKLALATAAAALMLPSCNEWIDIPVEATVPAETIDYTRQTSTISTLTTIPTQLHSGLSVTPGT